MSWGRNILSIGIVLMLGLYPRLSQAANKNVGTSGAQFLQIGAGARPTSMGDAFVGIADDANAVYFNPAGLGFLERPELTAMHTQWFQDMNYDFGAFVYPTHHGSFGISAATLKVEDQEKRGTDESLLGSFETSDSAYGLSYAKKINPRLALGGTLRMIDQEIDTASAQTWSGDIGGMMRLSHKPLTVGLAIRHLGPEVEFNEESDPLPLTLDAGVGYRVYKERILIGVDIKKPRDNDVQFALGGDWKIPLRDDFRVNIRSGYNSAITDADGASGFSLGGGMGYRQFILDFAWVPFGDLGNTFRYAAHIKF